MSIDLFLDDGKFHPPGSYDKEKLAKIFPKRTSFIQFKTDPDNFENKPYHREIIVDKESDKEDFLLDMIETLIDKLENDDYPNDVIDVVTNHVRMAIDKLESSNASLICKESEELTEEFKAGKVKFADGTQATINKTKAKLLNRVLKNTKYPDKLYTTATKSIEEFTKFTQFAELNESLSNFDSKVDDKIGSWASDSTTSDFKRIAAKSMKMGALAGKTIGLGIGTMAGVPIGATMAIRNISNAYRNDKYQRAHQRMMSSPMREDVDNSERAKNLIERFKRK